MSIGTAVDPAQQDDRDHPEALRRWLLYIVRSADDRLYTGITTDLDRRLAEHNGGGRLAAKALRGRAPVQLVFSCEFEDRSQASVAEYRVKQLPRASKELLVSGGLLLEGVLEPK